MPTEYEDIKRTARKIIDRHCRKIGLRIDSGGLAHDIAADLIVCGMRPGYSIQSLIYFEMRTRLHGRYVKRRNESTVRLTADILAQDKAPEPFDCVDPFDAVMSHEGGKIIMIKIWKHRRGKLRDLLIIVAGIAGVPWVRDNCRAISQVKKILSKRA